MNVGKRIRTSVFAPLALALSFATVAAAQQPPAQTQPATPPAQQQPPPAQQQPAQPAAATPTFSGDVGILLVQIKPDQTAAYEGLLAKLKEALAKSEKPERKAMAAGWKVYKSGDAMAGNTLYVHIVDKVSPGQDYLETYKLISEAFPTEVQDLYAKTKDAFAPNGLGRLNLTLVTALGGQ
jgi:hypothetical protein